MQYNSIHYNAILNVIKQICTIVFPIITFSYVTRTIGAENYGKLGFVSSIMSYLNLIAVLGRNVYAVREGAKLRDREEDFALFASQIYTINVITALFAYFILIVLYIFWPKLRNYSILVLIYSFPIIAGTIGKDWINTIYEDFRYLTIRYIIFQILSVALIFGFVKQQDDYLLYAGIIMFSACAPQFFNFFYVRKYGTIRLLQKEIGIKKHLIPMLVLFSSAIATSIYTNSDITIIGIFLNDYKTGQYSFSVSIYTMIKVAINAVIAVFVPRISNLLGNNRLDEYNRLLKSGFILVLTLALPSAIGLFMVSKEVTMLFGGEGYSEATISLKILCLSIPFSLLSSFLNSVILVPNCEEKYCLKTVIASAFINVFLNILAVPFLGIYGAAITTFIAEVFVFICFWKLGSAHCAGLFDIYGLISVIIPSVLIVFCCLAARRFFDGLLLLIVSVISSCIVFLVFSVVLKNPVLKTDWIHYKEGKNV